jgi:hypothetical protein
MRSASIAARVSLRHIKELAFGYADEGKIANANAMMTSYDLNNPEARTTPRICSDGVLDWRWLPVPQRCKYSHERFPSLVPLQPPPFAVKSRGRLWESVRVV